MKCKFLITILLCLSFHYQSFAQAILDATNGLNKPNSHAVSLGGTLENNTTIDLGNSFYFRLSKASQDYLRVVNNGNIGIGIANPLAQLHTSGTVRFDIFKNNADRDSVLSADENGNLFFKKIILPDSSKWAWNGVHIYNKNGGNIGIGVTNPLAKLHVDGTIRFNILKNNAAGDSVLSTDEYGNLFMKRVDSSKWSWNGNNIYNKSFGNVGIGTANPMAQLHSTGSVRFDYFKNNEEADSVLTTDKDGYLKLKKIVLPDSSKWAWSGNNLFNKNGGNIGIGVMNPIAKLHVDGSLKFDSFRNNAAGDSVLSTDENGNLRLKKIEIPVIDSSKWAWNGTNAYYKGSGNVGIGVENPIAQLHTSGTVRFNKLVNNSFEDSVLTTDTYGNLKLKALSPYGIDTTKWMFNGNNIYNNNTGNIGIGTTLPTSRLHTVGSIRFEDYKNNLPGDSVLTTDVLGNLKLKKISIPVIDSSKWAWNGSNIYYKSSGNVGIGLNTPLAQLHTTGTIRFELLKNNQAEDSVLTTDNLGNLKLRAFPSGIGLDTTKWENNDIHVYSKNLGNVGIGTSSPTAKLHALGSIRLESFKNNLQGDSVLTTDPEGNLKMIYMPYGSGGGSGATYSFLNGVTGSNGNVSLGGTLTDSVKINLGGKKFSFNQGNEKVFSLVPNGYTSSGTEIYSLTAHTNVFLGNKLDSLTSGTQLWFNGTGNNDGVWMSRLNTAIDATELRINIGDDGGSSDKFHIGYNQNNGNGWKTSFVAQANGHVGIGTSEVTGPLSVGSQHGDKMTIGNNQWASPAIISTGSDAQGNDYTDLKVPGTQFNNAYLRLNKAGIVSIGAANIDTAYRLWVNGKIKSKGLRVQTSGWADFVFEPAYKLRSLGELETYIKANKHLPEMPTADEVEKEGSDVGETQVKLLQKIEELTLYIIEQNRRVKELEENNKKLMQQSLQVSQLQQQLEELKKLMLNK